MVYEAVQIIPLGKPAAMKCNKSMMDLFVILLALLGFIIWHQNSLAVTKLTTLTDIKYYKVYLITTDKGFQYWGMINQGASDMAAATGIQYIWDAPDTRSTTKQIEIINKAVEDGANALIIAADDPKWISGPVEDAKARGVKVIYVDTPAYEEAITTLSTDNYQAGILAGKTMISMLNNKGIESGSIGIINLADKANTLLRETGFRDTLSNDGRFKLLDTIYTINDKPEVTQKAAESVINDNTDLVALFGTSEGTSLGVGYANKAHNNQFIGVGFDKTEDMTKLLNAGSMNAIINQNPYTMGYLGMAEAIAAIFGKNTGPEYIDTGVLVVQESME